MRQTNDDLDRIDADQAREDTQTEPIIVGLSSHITGAWNSAKDAKQIIQKQMLTNLRQREGIYEPDILAKIQKSGGSEIYMLLTDIKCRAAEAWIKDVELPAGEKNFNVDPTPIPELPDEVKEKAQQELIAAYQRLIMSDPETAPRTEEEAQQAMQEAAENLREELLKKLKEKSEKDAEWMTAQIDDILVEGGWYDALEDAIEDLVTYPTAFVEGPVIKKKKVLEWEGKEAVVTEKLVRTYSCESPYDVYPSPGARTLQDGDLCLHKRFTRRDLNQMIGAPGFDETAIREVLDEYGRGGLREWLFDEQTREQLHDRPYSDRDQNPKIDAIKYFGSVKGSMLVEWGMGENDIPDVDMDYDIVAYKIGHIVISARLNPHPLGHRNIYSASYKKKKGSIWGKGVPQLMPDSNAMCNGCARAIANNAGIASGPQVWMNVSRMPEGAKVTNMWPWKIHQFTEAKMQTSQPPMGFFQPQDMTAALLRIFEYFSKQASEVTGIPNYMYGDENVGGAGKTMGGLGMLMNAASKSLKAVAGHVDRGIVEKSVYETWLSIMLYEPDNARGDCKIIARASDYLMQQEMLQIRRGEFLDKTNNPTDLAIMGQEGRAEVLRENARSLKMQTDKIVPNRETVEQRTKEAEMQAIIGNLSQALNMPPEQIVGMMQGQAQLPAPKAAQGGAG